MKRKYLLLLSSLPILFFSACLHGSKKGPVMLPTPVSVAEAKTSQAVYYDRFQSTVVALSTVELRSEVAGFITAIYFKEGQVVKKGTLLYEIDRRKYIAAYNQAIANLASAEANRVKAQKDIDRYNMLLKNDAVATQTVDQAEAAYQSSKDDVDVAKAVVLSAKTDLSYATITAPFTGRIGISQVRLGSEVSPGTTLLNTISSEQPIGVDAVIDEQQIDRFYQYQRDENDSTFKLQLSDGSAYNRPGKLLVIDRGVNDQTGTITVRVQFPNDRDELKDGMSSVLLVRNNESGNRLQIPYKAITEQMGEFFVFVSQDTIAIQHKVKLGPRIGANVIVLSGLDQGDMVITDGFQRLRDKGKIIVGKPGGSGNAPRQ